MMTFKQYLVEVSGVEAALTIVRSLLGTKIHVEKDFDEAELDTAREVEHKFVKVGDGQKVTVSLFNGKGGKFVQVTSPSGNPIYFKQNT